MAKARTKRDTKDGTHEPATEPFKDVLVPVKMHVGYIHLDMISKHIHEEERKKIMDHVIVTTLLNHSFFMSWIPCRDQRSKDSAV